MDLRAYYRDKFGEAGTVVPCTAFNNELIYFGKLQFSQVAVYRDRLGNGIASLANSIEGFRLGRTTAVVTCFDIATDRELIYCKHTFYQAWMGVNHEGVYVSTCFNIEHYPHSFQRASYYWSAKRRVSRYASPSGGGQIMISPRPAKRTRSMVGLQLLLAVLRKAVSVNYGCTTMDVSVRSILCRSESRIGQANTLLIKGIIGEVRELHTLCGKWQWTSSDLLHVHVYQLLKRYQSWCKQLQKEAEVSIMLTNAAEDLLQLLMPLLMDYLQNCHLTWTHADLKKTYLETVCNADRVLTLHEAETVRKSYFKENTNSWPTIVGKMVTLIGDYRSEIETSGPVSMSRLHCVVDRVLTLHEVKAIRKSYFKENTNSWPTIIENIVNVFIDNRSVVDRVLTLHEAKTARKSYSKENQNQNAVVNGSIFKVEVLQNRTMSMDVVQQCVFNKTMLLLLAKNQVLLRGGSLSFCVRCLNPQAKTCKSHIISRCVLEQVLGNSTCIYISQKEELVSSNKCWFRQLCRNCDNSTCVDENKFKKRFCDQELKVSPQKIPAVELRVIYAFFFRGIVANIDLLLPIARNREWRGILNCVLRLREQCLKPRSAIKVVSCKLSNDSALSSQSLEFPLLVFSEKWGSFFYLKLQQYCYAIPVEQQQQDRLQANFPAVVKAISSKLGQKREKYLRNFSEPINQALMVTGYVTGGQLFI